MSIDLSFTKDPKWMEEREKQWTIHSDGLEESFRKKEIASIRHYFFTGELDGVREIEQGPRLSLFPLSNAEGWTYVYENLIRRPGTYKSQLYLSISTGLPMFAGYEASLRYFDYYNGDTYVGEGVAPVKIRGKEVSYKLDFNKVAGIVIAALSQYLVCYNRPVVICRVNYLFSVLDLIDDQWLSENDRKRQLLAEVFGFIFDYEPELEGDELKERQDFLKDFQRRLEDMDDNLAVKKLWNEVKQLNGAA